MAEGNGLLNRRRLTPYRGFKSRPLRHLFVFCSIVKMPAGSRQEFAAVGSAQRLCLKRSDELFPVQCRKIFSIALPLASSSIILSI